MEVGRGEAVAGGVGDDEVAAPFQGVVTVVAAGRDPITAPVAGTVARLAVSGTQAVDGGDLVVVLS